MINRLKKILQFYNLSPSSFADKLDIQRSSISHLFSGRNKPSLDFILKLMENFPEVDIYWFLNGKGEMQTKPNKELNLFEDQNNFENDNYKLIDDKNIEKNKNIELQNTMNLLKSKQKNIEKIVMFYDDKTFDVYNSN